MPHLALCVPYYRQPLMLARQLQEWEQYPRGIEVIVIDDGSPEPAREVLAVASAALRPRLKLYRVTVDKPWNREGARNLAATKAETDWICMIDLDHILPAKAAAHLVDYEPSPDFWYRFVRYRNGKADETRMKDLIPREQPFGEVKPHIDSYLITRELYWRVSGYDEDFVGCLGGGTEFLKRLERAYGLPLMLPADICLHVYTRDTVADASVSTLSRDTRPGKQIARNKALNPARATAPPLRFPWVREL
jgi:glycosyltransferase involved in cell wall biosynthesis